MSVEPRHEFYESGERVTISVFDKGANPDEVVVNFSARALIYENGEKKLVLDPLTGEVDPAASNYTVGKVKVEIRLAKKTPGRWVRLVRDNTSDPVEILPGSAAPGSNASPMRKPPNKNWESLSDKILKEEKENTMAEDPNAIDSNRAFADLFANVDDDAKRAIMKSYTESGGTTLSTDWSDVSKGPVTVKPPEGQEWRKWG